MAIFPTIEKYGESPTTALAALEFVYNPLRGELHPRGFGTRDLALKHERRAREIEANPALAWEAALQILEIQKKHVGPDGVGSAAGYLWDLSVYAMGLAETHAPGYHAHKDAEVAHSIHSSLGPEFYGGDSALRDEVVFDSTLPLIMGTKAEKDASIYRGYRAISRAYCAVATALNQLDRLDRLGKLDKIIQ